MSFEYYAAGLERSETQEVVVKPIKESEIVIPEPKPPKQIRKRPDSTVTVRFPGR